VQLNSKDITREEIDVSVVAGKLPTSWKESLAYWFEERKRQLTSGLLDVKEFEAKTNVLHMHALVAISGYIGANLKNKSGLKLEASTKDGGRQYIGLARTLANWQETLKPLLDTLAATATEEITNCEPIVMPCVKIDTTVSADLKKYRAVVGEKQQIGFHQAVIKETRRLTRWLHSVAEKGADAEARLALNESRAIGRPQRRGTLVNVM
jgi:hypothetical protein